jgi:hypothetical protein
MIDHLEKQTQSLPLDEKRGRGRPATGQALSNAERQRLYRERQKAQRNEKPETGTTWEDARALAAQIDSLAKELDQAKAENRKYARVIVEQARMIQEADTKLAQRNEKPAKVKRHRDQPAAELPEDKTYTLQARTGSGKWQNLVAGIYGEEASRQLDRVIDNKIAGSNKQYRLVEDGCV